MDEPTLVEWLELRDAWTSARDAFRELPAKPDPDEAKAKPAGLMETDVSIRFIYPLLRVLRWGTGDPLETFFEVELTVRVGSKKKTAFPDVILAPSKDVARDSGKPWAIVEAKRSVSGPRAFENARQQARLYADHLRVPLYAVVDERKIWVWRRFLLRDDSLELELGIEELGNDSRTHLLWNTLGPALRETAAKDRLSDADGPLLAASISNPLPNHYAYIRIVVADGLPKLRMTEATRSKTIGASWWWGTPESPGVQPRRVVIILGQLHAHGDLEQQLSRLRLLLARLQRQGSVAPLQCDAPDAWTGSLGGHRFALDGDYLASDGAEYARVPETGWSLPKEDELHDFEMGTWVEQLSESLDDWVVECTLLDWKDFVAATSTRQLPGAEEWRQSDDAGLRNTLAGAMDELGSVKVEHIRAAFWSHGGGGDTNLRRDSARLHLGPRTRLPVLEVLCMLAVVRKALPETILKSDFSTGKEPANLLFGPGGQEARAIALDRLESTHFRRSEDLSWATMALFRSIRAYDLHDKLKLKTLSQPVTGGIGAERVGDDRKSPVVFVLSEQLRRSLQAEDWAAVRQELIQQLLKTVSL